MKFIQRLVGYYRQDVARKFLSYGRLMRPIEFDKPNPMPTVHYFDRKFRSYRDGRVELPALQSGVFRSEDGEVGIFIVNVSQEDIRFRFSLDLARYGLTGAEAWDIERITCDGDAHVESRAVREKTEISGILGGRMPMMYRIRPHELEDARRVEQ
jgi:hypothetical protein